MKCSQNTEMAWKREVFGDNALFSCNAYQPLTGLFSPHVLYHHYKRVGYRYNIFFIASKFSQLQNIIVFHRFNEMKFKYDNQVSPPVKCFGLYVSGEGIVFKIKIVLL